MNSSRKPSDAKQALEYSRDHEDQGRKKYSEDLITQSLNNTKSNNSTNLTQTNSWCAYFAHIAGHLFSCNAGSKDAPISPTRQTNEESQQQRAVYSFQEENAPFVCSPEQLSEKANHLSEQRSLVTFSAKQKVAYAHELINTLNNLSALHATSETELQNALLAFNSAFLDISTYINPMTDRQIVALIKNEACSNPLINHGFSSVDNDVILSLSQTTKSSDLRRNLLEQKFAAAFQTVYSSMNKCREMYNLIYHQPRHAAEMFKDIHTSLLVLQNKESDELTPIHLLAVLCGLFHDIIFTHQRIADEKASAEALRTFLEPVLNKLTTEQKKIIHNLIYHLIVSATTPCLVNNDRHEPVVINLYELATEYAENNRIPVALTHISPMIQAATNAISMADIHRTSQPNLHAQDSGYASEAWEKLFQFLPAAIKCLTITESESEKLITEQLKISQGFRVIAELGASSKPGNCLLFSTVVAHHQSKLAREDIPEPIITWNREEIANFANKIAGINNLNAETVFAQRMSNSKTYGITTISEYEIKQRWQLHIEFLTNLYNYLVSDTDLNSKQTVISCLAEATANQAGEKFCSKNLAEISIEISKNLPKQTKLIRDHSNNDAPTKSMSITSR